MKRITFLSLCILIITSGVIYTNTTEDQKDDRNNKIYGTLKKSSYQFESLDNEKHLSFLSRKTGLIGQSFKKYRYFIWGFSYICGAAFERKNYKFHGKYDDELEVLPASFLCNLAYYHSVDNRRACTVSDAIRYSLYIGVSFLSGMIAMNRCLFISNN